MLVDSNNEQLFCEYDTKGCKITGTDFICKKGICMIHHKVFLYTRKQLEKAYETGFFTRPELRNKKKEFARIG